MSCLTAAELEIIRDHAEGDALSDSVYRAEVGALTLRLLDEHLNLRGALEEALDAWASLYEDRRTSGEPLEDPRIVEMRRLLDGSPPAPLTAPAAVNWEACYRRLHRDVAVIIGEDPGTGSELVGCLQRKFDGLVMLAAALRPIDDEARRGALEHVWDPDTVADAGRHAALVSAFAVLAWFVVAPSDSTTAPGAARVDAWTAMTDEGRLAFLAACQCCRNCGSLDTGCQCDNDE